MELEILKYYAINFFGNIVTYFLVAVLMSWFLSKVFGLNNSLFPFGWISQLFRNAYSLSRFIIIKTLLLLKIVFKWIFFSVEKILVMIAEIVKKFFELLVDSNSWIKYNSVISNLYKNCNKQYFKILIVDIHSQYFFLIFLWGS